MGLAQGALDASVAYAKERKQFRQAIAEFQGIQFMLAGAMKVTTDAVQVFGGYGYTKDYPVERWMRDAKPAQVFAGTNQIPPNFKGQLKPSTAFHQTAYTKSRLRPPCVVANPRHSYGYGCGLRLA